MHLQTCLHQERDVSFNDGFSLWDVVSGYACFLALEAVECGVKSAFRNSNVSVGSCGQFWTGVILVKQNCLVQCLVAVGHQEGFFALKVDCKG